MENINTANGAPVAEVKTATNAGQGKGAFFPGKRSKNSDNAQCCKGDCKN
jgi:hypothetical protein